MDEKIVRYVPGAVIDTRVTLEIIQLPAAAWAPIEVAYPEIATAGRHASFRSERNVTIFPPGYISGKMLHLLLGLGDPVHTVYPHPSAERSTSVLIHVAGGYTSLQIYRLLPKIKLILTYF